MPTPIGPATGHLRPARSARGLLESSAFKRGGAILLVVNVAFYAASLVIRDSQSTSRLWDLWLPTYVVAGPVLACLARALLGGARRSGAACLSAAMLSFGVGTMAYVGWTQFQADPPVPSVADLGYLGFYPFAAAAVLLLLRNDRSSSGRGLWLDASLGAAGSATALAAVLSPVLEGSGGELGAVVVGAAFSVADLLLIALICGVVAARGLQGGSMWLWLAAGLAVYCAADVQYALHVASGSFVMGSLWGVLWALGMTIAAFAMWRPERPRTPGESRSAAILVIPMVAVVTAVVVLVISSIDRFPAVVIALATATLVLAAVRTFVGFQQVRRLSDAHQQAVTDELTGLGNRRALFERGERRLAAAGASDVTVLMLIDLDDFKAVNDSLGHATGDELLRETARRLAGRVRHPDFLVRLGGDEFALVFGPTPGEDGRLTAERILDRIRQPFLVEGVRLRVDASAGVAETHGSDLTVSELLRRADVAMYAAKAIGSPVERYDPQLDEDNRARLETIQDLDAAIVRDQFVLHYQPKVDVATGAVIGAEALVRWEHPTRGLVYPDAFLPLVEQSGLMGAVTRLVLDAAIEQIARCRATGLPIGVAVNLSASDLLDPELPELITTRFAEHAVPVQALELEITESVLMTDPERAREMLERLRQLGLRIAVDDYGTGYCALAYLRDLPIDELKIDRSFIASVTADPRSAAIVRSTIELAHALGLEVVAEGVEHREALELLESFDCDFAQGYHFSRPVPADEFVAWARARTPAVGALA